MHSHNSHPEPLLLRHLHFPEEITEEILSRLPVKSLLRFRCVSKSWLSLIERNRFINKHLKLSTKNTSLAHHIVVYHGAGGVSGCSLQALLSLLKSESEERSSASASASINIDPTNNLPKKKICIVGCCNGLVCLSYNFPDGSFMLWNPATRVSMELPKLNRIVRKYGFGWDESSGAFKVFATILVINGSDDEMWISGQVYSSKTNSWKTVPSGSLNYLDNNLGVVVCGRIHWAISEMGSGDVIESFNLENDEFGRIHEPPPPSNANAAEGDRPPMSLGEIWGCLCALFDYNISVDVWVMKEYGVKESWFKLLTFPLGFVYVPSCTVFGSPPTLFGEGLNGDIFLICRGTMKVYTPKQDTFSNAYFGISYEAHVCVESLVSPLTTLNII